MRVGVIGICNVQIGRYHNDAQCLIHELRTARFTPHLNMTPALTVFSNFITDGNC
jgi:hypothetical protein